MNTSHDFTALASSLGLETLSQADQEMILTELARSINQEFLLAVLEQLGDKQFQALEASVDMGPEFYETSLKHLVPNHEELLGNARTKILTLFKQGLPETTSA